ncbi:MAG: DUF6754 domain-containing protein [Candidatus Neomarinimicrobiota bacterium]|jgi:hypothetical protein|nr:hypothetical protein [Candidatus Neomarinimicrobiota bacterium]
MTIKRIGWLLAIISVSSGLAFAELSINAEVVHTEADGNKVIITLTPVPNASSYLIQKSLESGEWVSVIETRDLEFNTNIENDISTRFKVTALDVNRNVLAEAVSEAITTEAKWFNIKRLNRFIALILISGIILYYITRARLNKKIYLRPVAGLQAFEEAVGRATEMGRSVLFVPGIMDLDQVETISGLIILGHVAKMTARYEADLNVPVSRSLVMESGRETVQASYISEGRPDLYSQDMVHYYTDDQFAFAAAVDGVMLREKPAAVFLQGKFYAESLIMAETGNSIGAIQIAGTGSPSQIPFFVTACDYTLIGEEFFAASAYLGSDPKLLGSIKGQDIVKAILMVCIGIGILFETFNVHFFKNLFLGS